MNSNYQDISNTILRVSLGIIFLAHGLLKLLVFTLAGTVQFFESIGLPGWLAYPVTFGEVIGGALLIVGLLTRPVLALMIPILLGATWVHLGNGWVFSSPNGGWEFPLFLVVTTVVSLLAGPGKWRLQKA
ncbi:MAG: DoxX family protein [Xanthomonadales bacterium]|nr:DoxX family protein [Gammaproteobacteria bacterium]NNE05668.1 DoxX family protein [Xanthomonadales bacterium]NNL96408.1 DoxX family protein [Xanthomonadales bacterium]